MKAKPRSKFDVLEIYHYLEHKAFPGFKYNGSNKKYIYQSVQALFPWEGMIQQTLQAHELLYQQI